MHVNLGGYHIRDVEISAAIDIDKNKVGKDLSEAIVTWPNNTLVFAKVPRTGITVQRGMTHDGLGKYLSKIIQKAPGSTVDIVQAAARHRHRRGGELPAGRVRRGHQVVRRAGARGRLRVRELHPGVHRARERTGSSASRRRACR